MLQIRDSLSKRTFRCTATLQALDQIICGEEGRSAREIEKEQPGQNVACLFHNGGPTGPSNHFDTERRQPRCAADSQSRVSTCLMFWNRS